MAKQGNNVAISEDRIARIETGVSDLKVGVEGIRSSISTLWKVLGLAGAGVIALFFFAGKSMVGDIAREVYREEFAYRTTISQEGKLTRDNMLYGEEIKTSTVATIQFRWVLRTPVTPEKVVAIRVQPRKPLPGVSMKAELADGGKACVMTLTGEAEQIEPAMPIDATVTIETRG